MTRVGMPGRWCGSVEDGFGEAVLALHCSTGSSAQWRGLGERLSGRYRLANPDFYGCGRREPWPGRKPLDLADQAAIALADLPEAGPVHVVGHSYGGAVAMRTALALGPRLASLVLIEPTFFNLLRGPADRDRLLFAEIAGVARAVGRAVENGHYWAGMAEFTDYWSGPGTWSRLSEDARTRLARQAPTVLTDFAALFADPTGLDACRRIAVPTLILRGALSPAPARRICDLLAARLPRAQLREIAGAGHLLPFTRADIVEPMIVEHIVGAGRARQTAAAA